MSEFRAISYIFSRRIYIDTWLQRDCIIHFFLLNCSNGVCMYAERVTMTYKSVPTTLPGGEAEAMQRASAYCGHAHSTCGPKTMYGIQTDNVVEDNGEDDSTE